MTLTLHADVYDQLQKLSDRLKLSKTSVVTLAIGKMTTTEFGSNGDGHAHLQDQSR